MTLYGMRDFDLGEPKVYGGYGMDAIASQAADVPEKGEVDGIGKHGNRVEVVETGVVYNNMHEASRAIGVTHNALIGRLKRGAGKAVVNGFTVRKLR